MIKALIIDDEIHARMEMQALLEEIDSIKVVGTCGNAVEALKAINTKRPDVLFLDIQMPVINGFEMLNMVTRENMPHVVFVTAYDQYSLKAFEEKTLDYLLKPVEKERLQKTIAKIEQIMGEKRLPNYETEDISRIPCLLANRIKLINLEDVQFVSTGPAGVHVATQNGEFFTEITLKVLEERTPLMRCHKQYLINVDCVSEILLMEGGLGKVITQSGGTIPVSRRYLKIMKKKLLL